MLDSHADVLIESNINMSVPVKTMGEFGSFFK